MTNKLSNKLIPVILSGGMGTRLWPLSRSNFPKQFHNLSSEKLSLIQETVLRVGNAKKFQSPVIICNKDHRFLVADRVQQIGLDGEISIILEPCARNTAPALAVAAHYLKQDYEQSFMLVMPSDHIISNEEAFGQAVAKGLEIAKTGKLVTFGITPTAPETGFGYIKYGQKIGEDGYEVAQFVEKPDLKTAQKYLESGEYGWNSGIFLFPMDLYLSELKKFAPDLAKLSDSAAQSAITETDFIQIGKEAFAKIDGESIDYAVMERTDKAAVIPMDCGWNDVGSWESLWKIRQKNEDGNVVTGQSYNIDTKNCFIDASDGTNVATLGVEDLVIISTKDSVLVAKKDRSQDVKAIVDLVKSTNPELIDNYRQVYRPWGHYDSIDSGERHQVKSITVKPGASLSLQMHYHRAEHWIVVSGTALVQCGDQSKLITENQSIYIPCGITHRIENPGKIMLTIIEVQSGSYLGEDDIVRFEDTYGRIEE